MSQMTFPISPLLKTECLITGVYVGESKVFLLCNVMLAFRSLPTMCQKILDAFVYSGVVWGFQN